MGMFQKYGISFQGQDVLKYFKISNFFKEHKNDDWNEIGSISNHVLTHGKDEIFLDEKIVAGINQYLYQIDPKERWLSEMDIFLDKVLKDKDVRILITACKLSKKDLWHIFTIMIIATMPNPVIKSGSAMLVPVVMFQDPGKILSQLTKNIMELSFNKDEMERYNGILVRSVFIAQEIKRQHDVAYGPVVL